MPRKPRHPCSYPGCKELTNNRYCAVHEKLANKNYELYERDKDTRSRYGKAWKRIRDSYAKEHPFCEECFKKGVLVKTEQVHHILPLTEGGDHSRSNLIALCASCHASIHAKRGDRWHKSKAPRGSKISV